MAKEHTISGSDIKEQILNSMIAKGEELLSEEFPQLFNSSAAFIYRFMPRPKRVKPPEYVYVPFDSSKALGSDSVVHSQVAIAEWNMAWEAGHLRYEFFSDDIPKELSWLKRFSGENIYLVPHTSFHRYHAYAPLFHLLPYKVLDRFGLPFLKKGHWPYTVYTVTFDLSLPRDFNSRLAQAFAQHIWPLIDSGSRINAFSTSEPLRLLAHNLDFWLPYIIG